MMHAGGFQLPVRLRPSPLEVACGLALGGDPQADPLPPSPGDPRAAFEASVVLGLLRPPCLVSFSGGRDSSCVLAAAMHIARRDGLDLPVPTTYRFARVPESEETDWQEKVIAHLKVDDWERIAVSAELDSVGPFAQEALLRHGVLWPFNAHFHLPVLQRAKGGTLLTGIGGDELLGRQLWNSTRQVLGRRTPVRLRHLPAIGVVVSPYRVRQMVLARRKWTSWPWIRPEVQQQINQIRAHRMARTPLGWNGAVRWWWHSRFRTVLDASMTTLAAGVGTDIVHPFMDAPTVAAISAHFGTGGPIGRTAALEYLFSDLLPPEVLSRRSKASFNGTFFSDHSRQFAQRYQGEGIDRALVDPELLVQEWRSEDPDPRSLLLMQAVWLNSLVQFSLKGG